MTRMQLLGAVVLLMGTTVLAGCAQPSPMDRAWDNCIRVNVTAFTDGDADAAQAECDATRDVMSDEEFIEMFEELYD